MTAPTDKGSPAPRPHDPGFIASVGTLPRAGSEVATVGLGGELFEVASRRLRTAVPFDGSCWFGTDPATVLPTTPVRIENIDPGQCEDYWTYEFTNEDVLLFRDLARSNTGGGTLLDATDSAPQRSKRYRDLLEPRGYSDQLRAAFRVGESTWGVVDLFRDQGQQPFTEREVALVTGFGAEMAIGLATLATTTRETAATTPDGPGTALYDANGTLCSLDAQAERWLGELTQSPWDVPATHPLMAPIWSILGRAQATAAGRGNGPARVRLRSAGGRWLILHASALKNADGTPGHTAVVIEPANSAQIAPIIVEAYSLTPREQQITQAVARGLPNAEIADELFVSVHTVRDHLKAVFTKLSVTSRGELVAKIFAEHYGPAIHGPDAVHAAPADH
ncbi:LuxR C-terminal-related transcriptional regulator [Williamsia sp. 1135]|uniref:helix-turn-helix transcriptional regulator n=1 Tax=Williamsia sp. 1135 TaxID=1889262 RepID=UPI000A11ECE1|nr:LuxR C-terminal-related transcriptional regulator [Williamsia sp. 1135]ORM38187.1 hypothetical protein BFL43_00805 [Williamsia sp. 1135]